MTEVPDGGNYTDGVPEGREDQLPVPETVEGEGATPEPPPEDFAVVPAIARAGEIHSARLLGQSVAFRYPRPDPPDYMKADPLLVAAFVDGWTGSQAES
jgi:hypothetical protein